MSQIEREREDYYRRLGKSIESAAEHLPEGWEISVNVEKECGVCVLFGGENGQVDPLEYDGEDLADTIENAIAYARTEEGETNG